MIVQWALMWVYRVSHCPTFSVNSLWIIGVCYRGMLVSVGQSHDISLWSILSLGNRSINVEMIYKLRVFDINWYLITLIIYVQTLKWLLGELTRGYDTPAYVRHSASVNYMNPGYFTLAATDLKPQQMHMFPHISARVWGRRWSPHI